MAVPYYQYPGFYRAQAEGFPPMYQQPGTSDQSVMPYYPSTSGPWGHFYHGIAQPVGYPRRIGEAPHMNSFTHPYHSESSVDSMEALMYDDQGPLVNALINPGQRLQNTYNETILPWYTPSSSPQYSTPRDKAKSFLDLNQVSSNAWREKDINQWECIDTLNWIIEETSNYGINYEKISMKGLSVTGHVLISMSESDFVRCDPEVGSLLYHSFQRLRYARETHFSYSMSNAYLPSFNHFKSGMPDDGLSPLEPMIVPVESTPSFQSNLRIHTSDAESDVSEEKERVKPRTNRVGRPPGQKTKKKPEKKCGRLWEFIRDLLLNKEYCPSLICWENYEEGVFRFVRSDKVAELWGTIKDNPKMTYEKLSRAMRWTEWSLLMKMLFLGITILLVSSFLYPKRVGTPRSWYINLALLLFGDLPQSVVMGKTGYYYKSKVLQPVLGRRLVYKFGPTATGWRTSNPNFRLPVE